MVNHKQIEEFIPESICSTWEDFRLISLPDTSSVSTVCSLLRPLTSLDPIPRHFIVQIDYACNFKSGGVPEKQVFCCLHVWVPKTWIHLLSLGILLMCLEVFGSLLTDSLQGVSQIRITIWRCPWESIRVPRLRCMPNLTHPISKTRKRSKQLSALVCR